MFKFDVGIGSEIGQTIADAIAEAGRQGDECEFDFNGVTVIVACNSNPNLIRRDWQRGLNGYLGESPTIGPHPATELSEEERASDAKVAYENERKRKERQAEWDRERQAKQGVLAGALSVAEPIELSDHETWEEFRKNNTDPYGDRVVKFADDWARLMQTRIAGGETIAECAGELADMADDDGITGFMYGAAVSVLAKCWKHGEELRRWHNNKTQIGAEGDEANESGGVLNPALLNVRS